MHSSIVARRAFIGGVTSAALMVEPAGAFQPGLSAEADRLRYIDTASRLSVATYVNGHGPFQFMVDTGATTSVIAAELAEQLGLSPRNTGRLHSIAGVQLVSMTKVDTLAVGKHGRRNITVAVLPRDQLRMDGVLGLEWLGNASLLLDFGRRRMVVGEALPLPDAQTAIVRSRLIRSGLILIDAYSPGQGLIAFIDSGSTTTAGNLAMMEAARSGGTLIGSAGATELRSVTGQVLQGRSAILSRLILGKMLLRNVPLVIGPIHTFEYWGIQDQPAIVVGTDVLRAFDMVAMDLKRNEVRFRVRA